MRRLSLSNKKPRGVLRQIRSLEKWATQFQGWFPEGLQTTDRYCNWKIPVLRNLIEGRHASKEIKVKCAQFLIDACHCLVKAKQNAAKGYRVTCVICVPDMFTSEICIYLDEDYFRSHTDCGVSSQGVHSERITGRSLAKEWGLLLPSGISEIGTQITFSGYDDGSDAFQGERWLYGEIDD